MGDAAPGDPRFDAALPQQAAVLVEVVAPVGVQAPGLAARPPPQAPDVWNRVEQRQELGDIVSVAAGDRDGERGSAAVEGGQGAGPVACSVRLGDEVLNDAPVSPPSADAAQKPPKKHRPFVLRVMLGLLGGATTVLCSAIFAFAHLNSRNVCTLVDSPAGISVDVVPAIANTASEVTLTACWDGACQERPLRLETNRQGGLSAGNPVMSTESVAATESPAASDTQASEPDERHVFFDLHDLPAKPVDVTLVLRNQNGAVVLRDRIRVTPRPSHPNGRKCAPGGPQARLRVTDQGRLILHARSANTPTPSR